MHEMGIALEIIDITIASIPSDLENCKVKNINLKLGKLSTITVDNLKFCFTIASKNTILSDTELFLEVIPVLVMCQNCGVKFELDEPLFNCKDCNSGNLKVLSGKELDIQSIEIEEKE